MLESSRVAIRPGSLAVALWFVVMAALVAFSDTIGASVAGGFASLAVAGLCVAMAWRTRTRRWRLASIVAMWWTTLVAVFFALNLAHALP